jgi:exonuclease SbcD
MIDCFCQLESAEGVNEKILASLPAQEKIKDAILRLVLEYPRDWETLIDENALRAYTAEAFELHLIKRPQMETRIRLPEDQAIGSLTPLELLELYWKASHNPPEDPEALKRLAESIFTQQD